MMYFYAIFSRAATGGSNAVAQNGLDMLSCVRACRRDSEYMNVCMSRILCV